MSLLQLQNYTKDDFLRTPPSEICASNPFEECEFLDSFVTCIFPVRRVGIRIVVIYMTESWCHSLQVRNSHEQVVANIIPEDQIKSLTPLFKVGLISPCAKLFHPSIMRLCELFIVSLGMVGRVNSTVT